MSFFDDIKKDLKGVVEIEKENIPASTYMPKEKLIIGMTFPKQDTNLGLEPSLLTVFPEGDNVIYSMTNDHSYDDKDVLYYKRLSEKAVYL